MLSAAGFPSPSDLYGEWWMSTDSSSNAAQCVYYVCQIPMDIIVPFGIDDWPFNIYCLVLKCC